MMINEGLAHLFFIGRACLMQLELCWGMKENVSTALDSFLLYFPLVFV